MAEPRVSIDPDDLPPTAAHLRQPLEDQLSSALQVAAHEVREDYRGEPVDAVSERLLSATREGLHPDIAEAFHPDRAQLRQVAEAIVDPPASG